MILRDFCVTKTVKTGLNQVRTGARICVANYHQFTSKLSLNFGGKMLVLNLLLPQFDVQEKRNISGPRRGAFQRKKRQNKRNFT